MCHGPGVHATLDDAVAAHAAHQRHAEQAAVEVVRPLMVRAREVVAVAEILAAKRRATMRADVLDDVDPAVAIANHAGIRVER